MMISIIIISFSCAVKRKGQESEVKGKTVNICCFFNYLMVYSCVHFSTVDRIETLTMSSFKVNNVITNK